MPVHWKQNTAPNARRNSHVAEFNGHRLEVFPEGPLPPDNASAANAWHYVIDGGTGGISPPFSDESSAMSAAVQHARRL
jgi:hypothetical protein